MTYFVSSNLGSRKTASTASTESASSDALSVSSETTDVTEAITEAADQVESALESIPSSKLEAFASVLQNPDSATSQQKQEFFPAIAALASTILPAVAPIISKAGGDLINKIIPKPGGGPAPTPSGIIVARFSAAGKNFVIYQA